MIKHVVSVSGGKDSAATLLIALENCPRENVVPIFCDTGNEHQAVYEYLDYLEHELNIKITRLKADFTERMRIHRERLLNIANGGEDYFPRAKFPWTRERAAKAAELMHPSGNVFLDLCMIKGLFPSHGRQFCTEELKRNIAVEFQLDIIDSGDSMISWQGVRRDESARRRNAKKMERIGPRMWAFRPLVDWTALDVFEYCGKRGIKPNPLYLQGMNRVGCMPCINVNKDELREIAARFPEQIDRIRDWERIVHDVSRAGMASMLHSGCFETIDERIEWAKTTRGGKQFNLLDDLIDYKVCSSAHGLCE